MRTPCRRCHLSRPLVACAHLLVALAGVVCEGAVVHRVVNGNADASAGVGSLGVVDDAWVLAARQYALSAGGALLDTLFRSTVRRREGGPLVEYDFENFDWSRGRQLDGSIELRLSYPLDSSVPALRWRQASLPTQHGDVMGYDPLDVPVQDAGAPTAFIGLRRATYVSTSATGNSWVLLDGCKAGCGFPSFGVMRPSDNGLLPGPCTDVNASVSWRSSRVAPSGCLNVKAVELHMKLQGSVRVQGSPAAAPPSPVASCRIGGWMYHATTRGLARSPAWQAVDATQLELITTPSPCDVPGYTVKVSCRTADAVGLLYDPQLSSACVTDEHGIQGLNTSVALSKGVYVDRVNYPAGTSDFSIAAWVKYTASASGEHEDIIAMNGVVLRVVADRDPLVVCGIGFAGGTNGATLLNMTAAYNTTWQDLKQLHHYTCVRSAFGAVLTLYVDGAPADVYTAEVPYALPSSSAAGSSGGVASASGGTSAAFIIDDLRVYPHALHGVDVAALSACSDNGPAAGILCDAAQGVLYFGSADTAQHGTCRVREYSVATGSIRAVRRSCPALGAQSEPGLHAFRHVTGISLSGEDLVVTGSASHAVALVPLDDSAAVQFVYASASQEQYREGDPLAVSCADPHGTLYHVNGYTAEVSVLRNRYAVSAGLEPLLHLQSEDLGDVVVGPVRACTATYTSLLVADAWGVVQIDVSTKRGSRLVGYVGGSDAPGDTRLPSNDATRYPTGACVSLCLQGDTLYTATATGSVLRVSGFLRDTRPVFSLLYGQPAEHGSTADFSSAELDYTAMLTNVQAWPQHLVAQVKAQDTRTCAAACNGAAVCRAFVWHASLALCDLVSTQTFTDVDSGTGVFYKKPDAARITPSFKAHAKLGQATAAAPLDIAPHAVCEMQGVLYALGSSRLVSIDLATGGVQHLAGNGQETTSPSSDVTPASAATEIIDGPLACMPPATLLLGQLSHGCVRALNLTSLAYTTVAGVCGTIGNASTTSGWVAAEAPLGVPSSLALHPRDDGVLYIATPATREVWEVDLTTGLRRLAAHNGTSAEGANGTSAELAFPAGIAWRGGSSSDSLLVADLGVLYTADTPRTVPPSSSMAWVAGDRYAAPLPTAPTREQLATTGYGDAPSAALLAASAKAALAHANGAAYTPSLHARYLSAVDLSDGRLHLVPLPAPLHGVTVAPAATPGDLLVAGTTYGAPFRGAVYRVSNLPATALSLGGGVLVAESFWGMGRRRFTLEMDIRFDTPLGAGNWTCLMAYGHAVVVGAADLGGQTVLLVDVLGVQRALPAPRLADGLWHLVTVTFAVDRGLLSAHVDGVGSTEQVPRDIALPQQDRLVYGCHLHVGSARFGADKTLRAADVSLHNITVTPDTPAGAQATWLAAGSLLDASGSHHLRVASGTPAFVAGPELPTMRGGTLRPSEAVLGSGSLLQGGAAWVGGGPCGEAVRLRGGGVHLGHVPLGASPHLELSLWFLPAAFAAPQPLLSVEGYTLSLDASLVPNAAAGSARCTAQQALHPTAWTHISAVYDLSQRRVVVAINGAVSRECSFTHAPPTAPRAQAWVGRGVSGDAAGAVVSTLGPRPTCSMHCRAQGGNRLAEPDTRSRVRGVGGVLMKGHVFDISGGLGQRLVADVPADATTPPSNGITGGAWVRLRGRGHAAGQASLLMAQPQGGTGGLYSGRWCAGSQLHDTSGGGAPTNYTETASAVPAPHGRLGAACSAGNGIAAALQWAPSASAAVWVQYRHAVPAWPQTVHRWEASGMGSSYYFELVVEPSSYPAALEAQWCVDGGGVARDVGPQRRHLVPMDPAVDAAAFRTAQHAPHGSGGLTGVCTFRDTGGLVAYTTGGTLPTLRTYMAWVFVDPLRADASYRDAYVLLHAGRVGYSDPYAQVGVSSCSRETHSCGVYFSTQDLSGVVGSVSSLPRLPLRTGVWAHVAVTWGAAGGVSLYVNGELVERKTISPTAAVPDTVVVGSTLKGDHALRGLAYDVRLYAGALNATQVRDISMHRVGYAASLKWRNGASDSETTCAAQLHTSPFPLGKWVHITASWDRTRGVWIHETAAGHERITACGDSPPASLAQFLDRFEMATEAAQDLHSATLFHDMRLRASQSSLAEARSWLASPLQSDWAAGFLLSPDRRPAAALLGLPLLRCPQDTPQLPHDTWVHVAVTVSSTDLTWFYDGAPVCHVDLVQHGGAMRALGHTQDGTQWAVAGSLRGWAFDGNIGSPFLLGRVVTRAKLRRLRKGESDPQPTCALQSFFALRDDERDDMLGFRPTVYIPHTPAHDGRPLVFDPRTPSPVHSPDGWAGLAGAPQAAVSVWAKPYSTPHLGHMPVFLGSTEESGSKWAEGAGVSAPPACARRAATVLQFSFDASEALMLASAGRGANAIEELRRAERAPGRQGSGMRITGDGHARGLRLRPGASTAAGLTVMFWAYHRSPADMPLLPDLFQEQAALYEVAREHTGSLAKAVLAFASSTRGHLYYGFATPDGVQGPDGDAAHVPYDTWCHVAATVTGSGIAAVHVNGTRVWSGVVNATSPWVWERNATVAGMHSVEYRVDMQSNCGGPDTAFVHEMPDGSNSTYLVGEIEVCKARCDLFRGCAGFVYTRPGDAAPPGRCYFRTSTHTSYASAYRDCYTKGGASAPLDVTLDDITIIDHVLPPACIAQAAGEQADTPAPCPTHLPQEAVMLHVPFSEEAAGSPAIVALPGVAGPAAAVDGGEVRAGAAHLAGRGSITPLAGCLQFGDSFGFGGGGNLSHIADISLSITQGMQYSLRLRASNDDTEQRYVGIEPNFWVRIPPGVSDAWFSTVAVATSSIVSNLTLYIQSDSMRWAGNLSVHEVQVCPSETDTPICDAWSCSCQGASNLFGMGPDTAARPGCADRAVLEWWDVQQCATTPDVSQHDACASTRQSWVVAFRIKPVAPADPVVLDSAGSSVANCTVAHEVVRSASRSALGVWQVFLCQEADGRLSVHSRMSGGGTVLWADTQDPSLSRIAVGVWSHVALVVDGSERRLYRDGVVVFSSATLVPDEMVRWHRSAQFFVSESDASQILVDELVVLQGSFCDNIFRLLSSSGIQATVTQQSPCALGTSSLEGPRPWAYLQFNDAWVSAGGRLAPDSSGNRMDFAAAGLGRWTHSGQAHTGAISESPGGGSLRLGTQPLRPLVPPADGALTVAFWIYVGQPASNESMYVNIFRTGSGTSQWSQGLLIGTGGSKVFVGLSCNGTMLLPCAAQTHEEAVMRTGSWHHVVLVRDGASVRLYIDGQAAPAAAFRGLGSEWAGVLWEGDSEWLSIPDADDAEPAQLDAYVDDLAVWAQALSHGDAIAVYRSAMGSAGLLPNVWHHIVWTLDYGAQTWYVNGKPLRVCRGGAVSGAGGLLVGQHGKRSGFFGELKDLQIRSETWAPPGAQGTQPELHRAGVGSKPRQHFDLTMQSRPAVHATPPPLAQEEYTQTWPDVPVVPASHPLPAGACTGCSADCEDACHVSHYTFDTPGSTSIADVSGNERHIISNNVELDPDGVHGTGCVQDIYGGSVAIASPALSASLGGASWVQHLSGSSRWSFAAWVSPQTELPGVVLVIEGRDSNATTYLWKQGGQMCARAAALLCCTEDIFALDVWQHIAVSVSLLEGRISLYADGELAQRCVGEPGVDALPDMPYATLFRSALGAQLRGEGTAAMLQSFDGRIDDIHFSSSELSATRIHAVYTDQCVGCVSCEAVDVLNVHSAVRESSPLSVATRGPGGKALPRSPLGTTAFRVEPLPDRVAALSCTMDAPAEGGDVIISTLIREGRVSLSAPSSGRPSCKLVCDVGSGVAEAVACGNRMPVVSLGYIGSGWYHCAGRVSTHTGAAKIRGGLVLSGAPAVLSGFHYRPAAQCGDGVVDYPAELCDPAVHGVADCIAPLCSPRPNPVFTGLAVEFRALGGGGAFLEVRLSGTVQGAPLRVFVSQQQNCSDAAQHTVSEVGADGAVMIPMTDAAFVIPFKRPAAMLPLFAASYDLHLCGPRYASSDPLTFRSLHSWKATRCAAECTQGSVCNILTGACVCQLGFTGPDCSVVVDGCAVAPDEAQCKYPSAATVYPVLLTGSGGGSVFRADPCLLSSCEAHGGTCHLPGVCVCPPGFSPPHCAGCLPGRTGALCDQFECTSLCIHGECRAVYSWGQAVAQTCVCDAGWAGVACDEPLALLSVGADDTYNATEGTFISADGRTAYSSAVGSWIALTTPDPDADNAVELSVHATAGVQVGMCEMGSDGAAHGQSWMVELGPVAKAWHAGRGRELGVYNTTEATVRLSGDTSVVSATFHDHALHVFQHACSSPCYGCAYLPAGAALSVL